MTSSAVTYEGQEVAAATLLNPLLWDALVGAKIIHVEHGSGTLMSVQHRDGQKPLISVKFEKQYPTFTYETFRDNRTRILATPELTRILEPEFQKVRASLAATVAKKKARAEAEAGLRKLAAKYRVLERQMWDGDDITPLVSCLEKLDSGALPDADELDWLEKNELTRIVALAHYREFQHRGDVWELVKACKYLRKCNLSEKAIEISGAAILHGISDVRAHSALLTSRGAALRDCNMPSEAHDAALKASELSPRSFHPYMLLGALAYDNGRAEDGDAHFDKATSLGASMGNREYEIRRSLEKSPRDVRDKVVAYLMAKDPKAYAWAANFSN